MPSLTISILLFLLAHHLAAQPNNLVSNPSFEVYLDCPIDHAGVARVYQPQKYVQDWVSPTLGTPDFLHNCYLVRFFPADSNFIGVPYGWGGYVPAHEGQGYCGLFVYARSSLSGPYPQNREYLQVELTKPMVSGREYCVQFYTRPWDTTTNTSSFGNSLFASRHIGAHFSKERLVNLSGSNLDISISSPHIAASELLNDPSRWTPVSGVYTAEGGERWITIGNFVRDEITWPAMELLSLGSFNVGPHFRDTASYYFIDDVSVHELDSAVLMPYLDNYPVCDAFPQTISAREGFDNYRWSTGDENRTATIDQPGLYWVETSYAGCFKPARDTVIVIAHAPPVVDIGPNISACDLEPGENVVLKNATPLNNYHWSNGLIYDSMVVYKPGTYTLLTRHVCGDISDEMTITECASNLFLPNVITPESNDINAVFAPSGQNVELLLLEIYDNWGHRLYRGFSTDSQWNGRTSDGRLVNPGVYVYKVRARNTLDGSESERIGDITVIR